MKYFTIRHKIFLFYGVIIILILAMIGGLVLEISKKTLIQKTVSASSRELAFIVNNLNSKMVHIVDYSITMAVDSRITQILNNNPNAFPNNSESYFALKEITVALIGLNRDIAMWDILTPDNRPMSLGGYDISDFNSILPFMDLNPEGNPIGNPFIRGPYRISSSNYTQPQDYFLLVKPVVSTGRFEQIGAVVFFITEESISSVFTSNISPHDTSTFYLIDSKQKIISSTKKEVIGTALADSLQITDGDLALLDRDGQLLLENGDVPVLYKFMDCDKFGWKVLNVAPLDIVKEETRQINSAILMAALGTLFVSLIVSYYFSRSITQPINKLVRVMRNMPEDHQQMEKLPKTQGEIAVLYEVFQQLMQRIDLLVEAVRNEQKEKGDFQFQLIQSQINPHFLYNTLETIKSLIDLDQNELARRAVIAMSDFYRLSLSSGESIIPVEEELRLCEQYMYIQKLRYAEYVDYCFEVDQRIYRCLIPKLTLQPILENAIYHGIKLNRRTGLIAVSGVVEGENAVISVHDNGVGINPESLRELQGRLAAQYKRTVSRPGDASFGLPNINRRIRLLYGPGYGLEISSREHEFTQVRLRIPLGGVGHVQDIDY